MTSPGAAVELSEADMCPALVDPVLSSAAFLNEVASRYPEAISLAAGRPYDGFFDPSELAGHLATYQRYLTTVRGLGPRQVTRELFQYGRTAGHIHELVAAMLAADEDVHVPAESIVVLDGAQEGMLVVLRALCHASGDVLLVPSPCYIGILGAARLLGIELAAVPEGMAGMDPAAVEAAAGAVRAGGRTPRALYVVPDFGNPSGGTLPADRRRALLDVAAAEDLLVVEDNPYGFLAEPGRGLPSLKALDRDRRVVHLGTFAKTCFPGARVGFVVADQPVRRQDGSRVLLAHQLALVRSMTTVNTSSIAQAVIGGMLVAAGCRLREAAADRAAFYRRNLALLLAELDRALPPPVRVALGVGWNRPEGGFFVVVRVPFTVDDALLERSAAEHGVVWTPMRYFYADGGGEDEIRLSCSALAPADLAEAVRRFAALVRAEARRAGLPAGRR